MQLHTLGKNVIEIDDYTVMKTNPKHNHHFMCDVLYPMLGLCHPHLEMKKLKTWLSICMNGKWVFPAGI